MPRKRLVIALVIALAFCLALAGAGLAISSPNYNLPWEVFSSGGGLKSSSSYRLGGAIGQPATGTLQSPSYRLESGYWTGAGAIAPPQPGDANGDGSINALDITKVERIIAGLDQETAGADANGDDDVNALDITKVERKIAGLD